jgi:hypothetical protein
MLPLVDGVPSGLATRPAMRAARTSCMLKLMSRTSAPSPTVIAFASSTDPTPGSRSARTPVDRDPPGRLEGRAASSECRDVDRAAAPPGTNPPGPRAARPPRPAAAFRATALT